MRIFNIILFNILIILLPVCTIGQTTVTANGREWGLSDFVNYGMEHNLSLKINANNSEKQRLSYQQSKWQLAPSLNGWGNGNLDLNRSTNQNNDISSGSSYSLSYGLNASINIFRGFTTLNTISAMKFNALAYNQVLEQQKNLLYIEILKSYAQSVFDKQQIKIAEEQLDIARKQKEEIESKVSVGIMSSSAVDEVNATVSGNQWTLDKQKNTFTMSFLSLTQLIELPDSITINLSGTEFDMVAPGKTDYTVEKVYAMACENLPDLKEKEFRLQYYQKELKATLGHLSPSLSAEGNYYSQFYSTDTIANGATTPLSDQYNKYLNPSVSISLSIPIFNKRSTEYEIKKSKIDIQNAILALEQQKNEVFKEIQNAIQQLNACYLEYQNANDNLKYVEKSFEIYREKYSLGLITSTDFITAQTQLLQAKTNVLSAKYNWIIQEKAIRLYSGIREF